MVSARRVQHWRRGRRVVRRALRAVVAVVVVVVVRAVLGVWATAALVALAGVVGLIAGWAAVEARVFGPRRCDPQAPVLVARAPATGGDQVAFARALAAVAAAYVADCARQETPR